MLLSPHFSLEELTTTSLTGYKSKNLAEAKKHMGRMYQLAGFAERVREIVGYPLIVTSGYRCKELNIVERRGITLYRADALVTENAERFVIETRTELLEPRLHQVVQNHLERRLRLFLVQFERAVHQADMRRDGRVGIIEIRAHHVGSGAVVRIRAFRKTQRERDRNLPVFRKHPQGAAEHLEIRGILGIHGRKATHEIVRRVEQTIEFRTQVRHMAQVSVLLARKETLSHFGKALDPEEPRHGGIVAGSDILHRRRLGQEGFIEIRPRQRLCQIERHRDNGD